MSWENQFQQTLAEQTEERLTFLASTSPVLLSSLDPSTIPNKIVDLVVPGFADWCVIDLLQGMALGPAAIRHRDPNKSESVLALRKCDEAQPYGSAGIGKVLRTGRPEFSPEVMIVPIKAEGETTGTLTLAYAESGRRYRPEDLLLAEELASRTAMAIHNARLYQKAQEDSLAKSEFLAKMSHELRTPLSAVIGFSGVLLKNKGRNLRRKDLLYLEKILANGKQLLELINQVLDLSKLEARGVHAELVLVSLVELIHETVMQFEVRPNRARVKLGLELPEHPAPIETDPTKLKQILTNLIGNGLKFTQRGSVTVRLTVDAENRPTQIDVIDTGIGIPSDQLDSIFESFRQLREKDSSQGAGLGLAISKSLCELLGYQLKVSSKPSEGSTFTVQLLQETVEPPAEGEPDCAVLAAVES